MFSGLALLVLQKKPNLLETTINLLRHEFFRHLIYNSRSEPAVGWEIVPSVVKFRFRSIRGIRELERLPDLTFAKLER